MKRLPLIWLFVCCACWSAWAGELKIDKEASSVLAEAKASPPHSFEVVVTDFDATIKVDDEGALTEAAFAFDFAALDSDSTKRDKKMRSWMDVESHPKVVFTLQETVERDSGLVAVGQLTMHGQARTVEIPYTAERGEAGWTLDGFVTIDHREWELEIVKLLFFKVRPELGIRIHIEGTSKPE